MDYLDGLLCWGMRFGYRQSLNPESCFEEAVSGKKTKVPVMNAQRGNSREENKFQSALMNFPNSLLDRLMACGTLRSYALNEEIYHQGAKSTKVYILLKGLVKTIKLSDDERTMIKDIVYPGNLFGEYVLFADCVNIESAVSIQKNTQVLSLDVKDFKSLISTSPKLMSILFKELGKKLIRREEKLSSFHFNDAASRIVGFIKETATNIGTRVGYETLVKHPFTQQDIANITGTSRQTVTYVLNSLKKANIIYFDRKRILIRDLNQL